MWKRTKPETTIMKNHDNKEWEYWKEEDYLKAQ
jgi:hypothetical protein